VLLRCCTQYEQLICNLLVSGDLRRALREGLQLHVNGMWWHVIGAAFAAPVCDRLPGRVRVRALRHRGRNAVATKA
jgi:hypothetical protein